MKSVESPTQRVKRKPISKSKPNYSARGTASDVLLSPGPAEPSLWHDLHYLLRQTRTALPMVVSDQLMLAVAVFSVALASPPSNLSASVSIPMLVLSLGGCLLAAFLLSELYPAIGLSTAAEVLRCTVSISLVFAAYVLASLVYLSSLTGLLLWAWVICAVLIPTCRYLTRRIFCHFRWWMHPVLLLGSGTESASIRKMLLAHSHLGLLPVDCVDDLQQGNVDGLLDYLACLQEVPETSWRDRVSYVMVVMPDWPASQHGRLIEVCTHLFPHVLVIPPLLGVPLFYERQWNFAGQSGYHLKNHLLLPLPRLIKRAMDLVLVLAGSLLILPLAVVIAIVIKSSTAGPIFYSQERIGRGGHTFRIWKFRTMLEDAEHLLHDYLQEHPGLREEWETYRKLKDDPRVIPSIGRFLRKNSLDELPQLWNVLKGEMSLVGPRPLPQYHLDELAPEFLRNRERVSPGITGLWQVASRSSGDPEQIIKHDSYYVRNWSLGLDLQILLRTPAIVLSGSGAC